MTVDGGFSKVSRFSSPLGIVYNPILQATDLTSHTRKCAKSLFRQAADLFAQINQECIQELGLPSLVV